MDAAFMIQASLARVLEFSSHTSKKTIWKAQFQIKTKGTNQLPKYIYLVKRMVSGNLARGMRHSFVKKQRERKSKPNLSIFWKTRTKRQELLTT